MKIDPTSNFVPYIILLDNMDEESRQRLEEDAERVYGSPWGMRLGDFFNTIDEDWSYIGLTKDQFLTATVRQYVWLKSFYECEMRVAELLHSWQIPQSPDAQKASSKCLKMEPKESVIVFVRKYFGLKNFDETMDIPLSDFILAKKDEYNNSIFQHTMAELQKQKMSRYGKHH